MTDLEPIIQQEYDRVIAKTGSLPDIIDGNTVSLNSVIKAHFQIANHFYLEGQGLGGIGPKDLGLLHSAVFRQVVEFDGRRKWSSPFEIAATLMFGLIKNHPFFDANKRTAFLCAVYQLQNNGWCLSTPVKDFEDLMVDIADNLLVKYSRYRDFKAKSDDPEVLYISWFLRSNTRKIDRTDYRVTYKQLQSILNRYGFDLSNPHNNYIDIVKREKRPKLLGFLGAERVVEIRIGQIGFPRWTAEVRQAAIKTVREKTRLTAKNGVDSAAFFQGVDSMQSLIGYYSQPLQNLARR